MKIYKNKALDFSSLTSIIPTEIVPRAGGLMKDETRSASFSLKLLSFFLFGLSLGFIAYPVFRASGQGLLKVWVVAIVLYLLSSAIHEVFLWRYVWAKGKEDHRPTMKEWQGGLQEILAPLNYVSATERHVTLAILTLFFFGLVVIVILGGFTAIVIMDFIL
jgi:hypothetical protein